MSSVIDDFRTYHWPKSGALGYAPLRDKYLKQYFSSPVVAQHLRKMGLINESGKVVADADFEHDENIEKHKNDDLVMAGRDQWSKRRDFQLGRQAGLQRHLAAVQKVLSYRKVKGTENDQREPIEPKDLERCLTRSSSLPILDKMDDKDEKFLPQLSGDPKVRQYNDAYYEYKNLHMYDTGSLQNFCTYLNKQLNMVVTNHSKMLKSAAMLNDHPNFMLPPALSTYPALKSNKPKIRPLIQKWRWKYFQDTLLPIKPNAIIRSEPAASRISRNSSENNKASSDFSILAKMTTKLQTCQCYIIYVNNSKAKAEKSTNNFLAGQVKMTIQQQHSGGNTITVFRDIICPNGKITFDSYRKVGQMFAIVISIDDQVLLRLNTCCESKYKIGSRLGGKTSPIIWLGTKNAVPCYKCKMSDSKHIGATPTGQPHIDRLTTDAQDMEIRSNRNKSPANSQSPEHSETIDIESNDKQNHNVPPKSASEYSYSDDESQDFEDESTTDNEKINISQSGESVASSMTKNEGTKEVEETPKRPLLSDARKVFSYDPWICKLCKFDNFYDEDCCRICGALRG